METFTNVIWTLGVVALLFWLATIVGKKPARYCPKHEKMCDCRTHPNTHSNDTYFLPPM